MSRGFWNILVGFAVVVGLAGCQQPARPGAVELPDRDPPGLEPARAPVAVDVAGADERRDVAELVGRPFRVHLRRDALGLAAPSPLSPDATQVGGRSIVLEGVVERADGQWVVLLSGDRLLFIPKEAVLMLELMEE